MKYSEKRRRNIAKIFAIILIAAMVLSSGYYIMLIFANDRALSALAVYGADALPAEPEDSRESMTRLDGLEDFIDFVHEFYKDPVTYEALVDAAYTGVIDSLDDPWSVYYVSTEESDNFVQSINQEYSGVGVTMTLDNNGCLVSEVNRLGPAFEAGLRAGCYIVKVDGVSVSDWSLNDISSKVRGIEGTTVVLTVTENGVEKDYTITRRHLKVASVEAEMLEDNIGYIAITSFADSTVAEFTEAKLTLFGQGANSLIIDLRDNGGGYVNTALLLADELLEEGILSRFTWRGEDLVVYEAEPDLNRKVPMVLLVNGGTASASEIFAAALQDNGAAKLVGTRTYGKGVAQTIQPLEYSDSVKLSIYYFESPKGNTINGVGLTPDYLVEQSVYTQEEAADILDTVIDMAENKKYHKGEVGLNVLAAQQRLFYLGYDVDWNGRMDDKTVAAIKAFQPTFGGSPYGGLDFSTQKAICAAFDELFTGSSEDRQLLKAVEILSK